MARDNNGFGWFLAGLGLGALVGVLYAPKSGRETRQSLMDAAEEGRDFVVTKGRQARDQVGQYSERGKEVLASSLFRLWLLKMMSSRSSSGSSWMIDDSRSRSASTS